MCECWHLESAPVPITLSDGLVADHDRGDVFLVLLDTNGEDVARLGYRGFGAGQAGSARFVLSSPDSVVIPAVVACTSSVSLWVETSLLIKGNGADAVGVAVDATASSTMMSAGHEREYCGTCWTSAARSARVRL